MHETAIEIAESVRRGDRRAVEVLDAALARVERGNARLGAFVHLDEGLARASAEAVDAAAGGRGVDGRAGCLGGGQGGQADHRAGAPR